MKTILVVEDNPDNLDLVTEILEDEGYIVTGANSAEEGIRLVGEDDVDLVLMDIGLPDMDGLEATKIIKSDPNIKDIPIVALTAYAMKGDREKVLNAGCDGYLTKPLEEDELIKKIKEFIGD
ncbi:MAG: response regulator [Halobacteriota archaeon]|nr:response regulator [Halobacteriota archaeon]